MDISSDSLPLSEPKPVNVPVPSEPFTPDQTAQQAIYDVQKKRRFKRRMMGIAVLIIAMILIYFINRPSISAGKRQQPDPRLDSTGKITNQTQKTQAVTNTHSWNITTDEIFYSIAKLGPEKAEGRNDVTGTLYTPLRSGEYFCQPAEPQKALFIEKLDTNGWVRLCDQTQSPVGESKNTCSAYDIQNGKRIFATFYPVQNCASEREFEEGYYRLHGKIFTGCTITGEMTGEDCKGIVDVYSSQFLLGK